MLLKFDNYMSFYQKCKRQYQKIQIKMSLRKKQCSVPRTQPTKSSSRQTSDRKIIQYEQFITCPETSCFNEFDTSLFLKNVDYGKLQQPPHIKTKTKILTSRNKENKQIKEIKEASSDSSEMEADENTRRKMPVYKSTEIHRLRDNSLKQLKRSEIIDKKLVITQSFKELKRELNESQEIGKKLKCKLNQVRAYSTKNCEKVKKHQGVKERKKIYSRILKTYVGGAPMKTKIITYPDVSQYQKICGNTK